MIFGRESYRNVAHHTQKEEKVGLVTVVQVWSAWYTMVENSLLHREPQWLCASPQRASTTCERGLWPSDDSLRTP
jgi:hypothetical protein